MRRFPKCIKYIAMTIVILLFSFAASLLFQHVFNIQEHITTIFVFAVFLVSLWTPGYVYGLVSAFVATAAVNYAFTFPYFRLNFTIPVNLISGVVMIGLSVLTSALTTKLKRHEAMKAEGERERMRANLLRAVSHDLRTPLTTIYGSGTTLLEKDLNLTPEQRRQIAVGIKEDAEWLIRMVENLLSITRIDDGKVKIIKTPTVLEELLDSVIVKFKKRYPMQAVELKLPDKIVMIPMDAILIEQVIINILENAVQHAVGMTRLSLSVSFADGKALFEIADNGEGVRPERMQRLFDGYYAPEEQIADGQKKNAGIGLAVCATIVRAHGGEISAEIAKKGGMIFRFTLEAEEIADDE